MALINNVAISGRIADNVKLKRSTAGEPYFSFRLLVSGDRSKYKNYLQCIFFTRGDAANNKHQNIVTGDAVLLVGRISFFNKDLPTGGYEPAIYLDVNKVSTICKAGKSIQDYE
jgi:single-stranded DNA-binding protein